MNSLPSVALGGGYPALLKRHSVPAAVAPPADPCRAGGCAHWRFS